MQDNHETSATHALIAVCQWLDEMTRQCEEQQERILELMNSLSISINDKLGTALDWMTDALNTTRAILSKLQRLQRYLQLGEDTHTREKGKGREERPKQTPGPSMSYFPEEHKLWGRFASRAASERTTEYGWRLEEDAEEIYFPPREEEEEAKRHCLEVRRQLNNYQRYSQGPPNNSPCTCKVDSRPPPERRENSGRRLPDKTR